MTERRDARFAELDALCAAGWGSVPGTQIERIRSQNGGVLPEPPAWANAEQEVAVKPKAHGSVRAALDVVIEAGREISAAEVAAEIGSARVTAAALLKGLRRRGLIEMCGEARSKRGQRIYLYRAATRREVAA
jgi:hypothetical protein